MRCMALRKLKIELGRVLRVARPVTHSHCAHFLGISTIALMP